MTNDPLKIFKGIIIFYFIIILLAVMQPYIDGSNNEESTGSNDYARITSVDYKAVVLDEPNTGGDVLITERLTYDIHAASKYNLFWELWRDLPEDEIDGLKVDYDVLSVKQINNDGTETIYEESPKLYWEDSDYTSDIYGPGKWYHSKGPYSESLNQYECVLFYVDGLYREKVVFEIQYIMNNASLKYNDVSELYLAMYSEETIKYLESFNAQILVATKDMPAKGNYKAHTYGTNLHTFPYTESDTLNPGYHTFAFSLDKSDLQFRPYNQYIEFSLLAFGPDRHSFTHYAPNNYYSHENYLEEALKDIEKYDNLPIEAQKNKKLLLIGSTITSLFLLIFVLNTKNRIKKKHNFYEPEMTMDYFREIPSDLDPYFAAQLVFCKDNYRKDIVDNGYSAIMLNLIRKGYVELTKISPEKDWDSKNIQINILYNPNVIGTVVHTQNTLEVPKNIPAAVTPKQYVPIFPTIAGHTASSGIYDAIQSVESSTEIEQVTSPISTTPIQNPFIEHENNVKKLNEVLQQSQLKKQIISNNDTTKIINKRGKILEPLSTNEEAYFNMIVRHTTNESISMSSFQHKVSIDYDNTDTFVTTVENSVINIGISQGYLQKADYLKPKKEIKSQSTLFLIFGLLIITLGNALIMQTRLELAHGAFFILGIEAIICSLYLKYLSKKYVLLTQFGENEYAKWRALYNFLNSATLIKERTVVELPLWEKYLVYATAFGISDKVIKALEIRCPDIASSPLLENKYYRSNSYRISSRSFRSATRSASSISRSSRFSGGGGYYGGGGRGGGGGGGGH